MSAEVRLHEAVGDDAGFLRIGPPLESSWTEKSISEAGVMTGTRWLLQGFIRKVIVAGTIGKVSVRLSV